MDKQSGTSDTINPFKLEILKRYILIPDFLSLFQRVSNILQFPVSVHLWQLENGKATLVWSNKKHPLCEIVLSSELGERRCFIDRYNHAQQTGSFNVPFFYKCHAGFSCGCVHLINWNEFSVILSVGPFRIEETRDVFLFNVEKKLKELGIFLNSDEKKDLDTISFIQVDSVKEILLWTKESFLEKWNKLYGEKEKSKIKYLKSQEEGEGRKEKDIDLFLEKLDKVRSKMFLIAIMMGSKQLMSFILHAKGEELMILKRNLSETKFSLYSWVINLISSVPLKDNDGKKSHKKSLFNISENLFSDGKSLKCFINKMIRIANECIDEGILERENKRKRFDELFSVMKKQLLTDCSLLAVSDSLGVSNSALSHWIRRNIGINYEELLDYIQVEEIAQQLRKTNKTLSRIGNCVGIPHSSLVSEKFQRVTGTSTTEYKTYFCRTQNRIKDIQEQTYK